MNLEIKRQSRVLRIILDRPQKRNALTLDMCSGIADAVESVQDDPDIGSIFISAAGKVFCAGMDVDERGAASPSRLAEVHDRLFTMGSKSLKPIVLAVNGAAMGGGLGLVTQGHVVIAASSSAFALPEIRLGLWPFLVYRSIEEAIGPRRMLALSLTGHTFHAEEALAWGIVHHMCPDDEVLDRAGAIASDLAKASPAAITAGMRYVRDARGKSWDEAGQIAAELRDQLMDHADFEEGCRAFKERREPRWPSMPQEFYARPRA